MKKLSLLTMTTIFLMAPLSLILSGCSFPSFLLSLQGIVMEEMTLKDKNGEDIVLARGQVTAGRIGLKQDFITKNIQVRMVLGEQTTQDLFQRLLWGENEISFTLPEGGVPRNGTYTLSADVTGQNYDIIGENIEEERTVRGQQYFSEVCGDYGEEHRGSETLSFTDNFTIYIIRLEFRNPETGKTVGIFGGYGMPYFKRNWHSGSLRPCDKSWQNHLNYLNDYIEGSADRANMLGLLSENESQ